MWLFFLIFAVRLLVLCRFTNSLEFLPEGDDMQFYTDWALRIAHGQWTDHQAFYGLPGYAYCLAFIIFFLRRVGHGFDPFVVGTACKRIIRCRRRPSCSGKYRARFSPNRPRDG